MSRDSMELVGQLEEWAKEIALDGTPSQIGPSPSELTEAAACIREMVEWRPIETAPMDGTMILCFYPDRLGHDRYSLRYWATGDWPSSGRTEGWSDQYRQLRKTEPTHWLPLPPAPGAEARGSPLHSDGWPGPFLS